MTGLALIFSLCLSLTYHLLIRRYARPWSRFLTWLFILASGLFLIHDSTWKTPDWIIGVQLGRYQLIWELLPYTGYGAFLIGVGVFLAKNKKISTVLTHIGLIIFASFYIIVTTILLIFADQLASTWDLGFGVISYWWMWIYTCISTGIAAYLIVWSMYNLRLSLRELDPEVIKRDLRTLKDWLIEK